MRSAFAICCRISADGLRNPRSIWLRYGLLTPARTEGGTRRYSNDDLDRLARITELLASGVNLAGVAQTNLGPGRDKLLLRGVSDGAFTGRTSGNEVTVALASVCLPE